MQLIELIKKLVGGIVIVAVILGFVFAGSMLAGAIWAMLWVGGAIVFIYLLLMVHNYLSNYLTTRKR